MINILGTRFNKAKEIYQNEGLITLLKRILADFENSTFYVSEIMLQKENESEFMPKINDFTCKILETTQQLDELLNYGFDLSLLNIIQARQRLEKGAIAALIFVGRELAYTGWMAMTEEAKNTFNRYPYKVDFSNNEACTGGAWTNLKYRRLGLSIYGTYKRREYLMAKGIKKTRSIMLINNVAMLKVQEKLYEKGVHRTYATARYIRIFGLQFWKETPVASADNN